jgi:aldose 1-epimerase
VALTGRQYRISAGEFEATVVEVGGGLRRFARAGDDITATYGDDELPPRGCGAVLVPWPNRLRGGTYSWAGSRYQLPLTEAARGNAIHGLGRWARWSCVRHETGSVTMGYDIPPQPGWPFEVVVEVTYTLTAATGLSVTAVARNLGTAPAPFGAGFHPYLALPAGALAETSVRMAASQHLVTDDAQIPVGSRPVDGSQYDFRRGRKLGSLRLDDGFTGIERVGGRGEVVVGTRASSTRVWFDDAFGYVQLFTPDLLARGRPAIAVEPMTCPADAFNSGTGLVVLQPSGTWTGTWGITPL